MGTLINPEFNIDLRTIGLYDLGDVSKGSTLEEAHTALEKRVRTILDANASVIPFVVGGSNDQSYPNAAALMGHLGHGDVSDTPREHGNRVPQNQREVFLTFCFVVLVVSFPASQIGVINIDAHFDVRPFKNGLAHSGSPFRQLLEDARFSKHLTPPAANSSQPFRFVEYAAQGSQCSKEHADYLLKAGNGQSKIFWVNDSIDEFKSATAQAGRSLGGSARAAHFAEVLNRMAGQALFVSFDLDSVTGADAPGVSCPGTIGLSAHDALFMAYAAGLNPRVRLFDLSEFNPKMDEYRTGRLVANMFYYFCLGVASRKQQAAS